MAEEEEVQAFKNPYSRNVQKVLSLAEKDPKFVTAIRMDAQKALASYNLTATEIKQVKSLLGR